MPGRHYATGHVNEPLIALVPIRATDPVAIFLRALSSCPFVQFVGKNISLIISIAPAKDNFKLYQVVPVVVI